MGVLKNTWTKKPAETKPSGTKAAPNASILSLQKWLNSNGLLTSNSVTGFYNEDTHIGLDRVGDLASQSDDPSAKELQSIIDYMTSHKVEWIRGHPDFVTDSLFKIQQALKAKSKPEESRKRTPNYPITVDGKTMLLPLALVYTRGWQMYKAILEQNDLLNPLAEPQVKLQQLNKIYQDIMNSLPAEDQNNTVIRAVITEADKDLRQALRIGITQEEVHEGSVGSETISAALAHLVPEFAKAPNEIKNNIIGMIYYRFPSADKFMETPANVNSKVTNVAEFRRNQASLTEVVSNRLRQLGYKS